MGLFLLDVLEIDDSKQTLTIDLGLSARWYDPRLLEKAGTQISVDDAWMPNLQVLSERDLRRTRPELLHVGEGGRVEYLQRFIGELGHPSDLSDFPFDKQTLVIRLITPMYSPEEVELVEDVERTGQSGTWSLVGWNPKGDGKWSNEPYFFEPAKRNFSGVTYSVETQRQRGYYIWKVFIPLFLVVLMSWTVFWIDPTNSSSPISVAVTSILTLVAYRFVLGRMVPDISYLTGLDVFMLGASVLVFFVLVEAVWTGRLAASGDVERAVRIDRACRWIFPLAFGVVLLAAFAL